MAKYAMKTGGRWPVYEIVLMAVGGILVGSGVKLGSYLHEQAALSGPLRNLASTVTSDLGTQASSSMEQEDVSDEELAAKINKLIDDERHAKGNVSPGDSSTIPNSSKELLSSQTSESEASRSDTFKSEPSKSQISKSGAANSDPTSSGKLATGRTKATVVPPGGAKVSQSQSKPAATPKTARQWAQRAAIRSAKQYYTLQVGVYLNRTGALKHIRQLKQRGITASLVTHKINGRRLNYVYVGRFSRKESALEYRPKLHRVAGINSSVLQVIK